MSGLSALAIDRRQTAPRRAPHTVLAEGSAAGGSRVSGIVIDSEDGVASADVGIPFEVRLAATPTTGDGWEIAALPAGVELLGSDQSVFRLRASQPGRFELRFVAQRRWKQEPIEIRVVVVEAAAAAVSD